MSGEKRDSSSPNYVYYDFAENAGTSTKTPHLSNLIFDPFYASQNQDMDAFLLRDHHVSILSAKQILLGKGNVSRTGRRGS